MPRPPEKHPRLSAAKTRDILEELFEHPPVSRAELEQRLAPVSLPSARRLLAERLAAPELTESDGELLVSVFQCVGVGQQGQALVALVSNPKVDQRIRAHALTILLHEDPAYGESLRQYVSDSELLLLAAQPLCNVIATIEADPAEAEDLAAALESVAEDLRPALFAQVEEYRRQVGTPAAVAYEQVLRRPALLPLRPIVIAAMVHEGGHDALSLIEALRNEETDATRRRALQGALLRLHTRSLDGHWRGTGEACAYVSSCDGQGAFFVLGHRDNPDGRCTLAMLCVRAAGDVRDGYVVPGQPPEQVDRLLRKFADDASTEFVRVTVAQASPLVQQAVARTLALGMAVPLDAVPALRFFERVEGAAAKPGAPEPPGRATRAALRKLMRRPAYRRSWFFDESDLNSAGIAVPARAPTAPAQWLDEAARRLARSPALAQRLVAMADHMAVWHGLAGEPAAQAELAAARRATAADFAKSPLVHVLLERTWTVLQPRPRPLRSAAPPRGLRTFAPAGGVYAAADAPSDEPGDEIVAAMPDEVPEDCEPDGFDDEADLLPGLGPSDRPRSPSKSRLVDPARRQILKARFFAELTRPTGRDLALLDLTEATLVALQSSLELVPSDCLPREEHQQAAAHGIATVFRDYLLAQKRVDIGKLSTRFAAVLAKTCHLPPALCDSLGRALLRASATFVDKVCHRCPVGCLDRPRSAVSAEFFSPEHPALH
jgi:hypothetical protein